MIITRVIITVKNRPRISLVKLVVSITYPLFLAKSETTLIWSHYFWKVVISGVTTLAFANNCQILSLLSEGHGFFREEGCRYYRNFTVNKIASKKFIYLGTWH